MSQYNHLWIPCLASALGWIYLRVRRIAWRGRVPYLVDQPLAEPEDGWPPLTVLLTARDEAGTIEASVRSLLRQDYPNVSVIAVDDRSTDGTGAKLDALAEGEPRLKVLHVSELPAGWLGKTHALQAAADEADSDWLLFTDADVIFEPGALRRAVALALSSRADHLVVTPYVPLRGFFERLFMSVFVLSMSVHAEPRKVMDPRRRAALGIGAFNLVRTRAFRDLGGFRHIALSIDDDLRLAQALKAAGYRTIMALGGRQLSVRWQVGLRGMIRGIEKNAFAALDFRPVVAATMLLLLLWSAFGPFVGSFLGPWWSRWTCMLGILAICQTVADAGRQNGIGGHYGLAFPLGALLLFWAFGRSILLTLARGGVVWRDRLYPLPELKAHVRRRNEWLREVWRSTH